MDPYQQFLKELTTGWTGTPRQDLLSPGPASPRELLKELPPQKRYLGPGAWYNFIAKLNQEDRYERAKGKNR